MEREREADVDRLGGDLDALQRLSCRDRSARRRASRPRAAGLSERNARPRQSLRSAVSANKNNGRHPVVNVVAHLDHARLVEQLVNGEVAPL